MEFIKLSIEKSAFNINLKFYFWLKYLVKTGLSDSQSNDLLQKILSREKTKDKVIILQEYAESLKGKTKSEAFYRLISDINNQDDIDVFMFSLKLYMIKDLLLAESKLKNTIDITKMANMNPLSLAYDNKTLYNPYATRVNGALLSLLFFNKLENSETNFLSQDSSEYLELLSKQAIQLKAKGLEPNQIFMLMFSESINQSIMADSGSNYEDRIFEVLINIGIPKKSITKIHDKDDKSTEFDLFFELDGRTYGIGAKRTLRERYKQFIKTSHTSHIDVMIEITLGLDLNEDKAKTIISHGTVIFVSDEIYLARDYLQKIKGVYSVKDLTIETFRKL